MLSSWGEYKVNTSMQDHATELCDYTHKLMQYRMIVLCLLLEGRIPEIRMYSGSPISTIMLVVRL